MDPSTRDRETRLRALAGKDVDIGRGHTEEPSFPILQGRISRDPHGEIREMDRLRKEGRPFLDLGGHMGRKQAEVRTVPGEPGKAHTGR